MNAIFYTYNGDPKKLNKTLEDGLEQTVFLKNGSETLTRLEVALTLDNSIDFKKLNYVYIEDLKRYYFVDDIQIHRNQYYILSLSGDVLMSFKNEIKNISVEVVESSKILNDNKIDYTAEDKITRLLYNMQTPFTDEKNIIMIGV